MRLLVYLMSKEAEEAGERALDLFKQQVFASAFGSFNPQGALGQYHELFESGSQEPDYEVESFEPQDEADVAKMMNEARRAGVIY